jgi:methionine-S-sulfoxide reductase
VIRTRVGYAGGLKSHPTYHDLGDHTETLQVDFDPSRITYGALLDVFWAEHNPGSRSWSRQYMAAIFYHTDQQRQLALTTRDREAAKLGSKVYTEVLPASTFTQAEEYHQKYSLRGHRGILREFKAMYPQERDLIASTAVARANGYLAGHGTRQQLESEIDGLGLSPEARLALRKAVGRNGRT